MAVSVWVEAMRHAPGLPREHRIPFCNGVGVDPAGDGHGVRPRVGYYLQALLPALFGAAAMFITPISFLTSTARNARLLLEKAALGLGLVIGPVLAFSQVAVRPAVDRRDRRHAGLWPAPRAAQAERRSHELRAWSPISR